MSKSIADIENEIREEFSILEDDRESTLFYIMELGDQLAPMPESDKTEENIIKGCQSKVWLTASENDGKVYFMADSNTDITRGLISLLVRVLNERSPKEILNAELGFLKDIGMDQIIGSQRSNGLTAMIRQMKLFALALDSAKAS
jgi:cysteine desulfuration protein SufE